MKLLAISDLHLGNPVNREALQALPEYPDDWLILAGDLAELDEHIRFAFKQTTQRFKRVIWVPGNHELWSVQRQETATERYVNLVNLAHEYNVITPEDPYPTWSDESADYVIAPLFLLYDYSFRPDNVSREQVVEWAREHQCVCADEYYLNPAPWPSREAWCAERCRLTAERLRKIPSDAKTVLINHFPLRQDLIYIPRIPRFIPWCGTKQTQDWHQRFNAAVAVSGHLHTRRTDWRGNTRFEEVSLGYPKQWKRELGIAHYLREILPGVPSIK